MVQPGNGQRGAGGRALLPEERVQRPGDCRWLRARDEGERGRRQKQREEGVQCEKWGHTLSCGRESAWAVGNWDVFPGTTWSDCHLESSAARWRQASESQDGNQITA